ncbi:MAG: hypothetical protein ABSC06_37535 [Rhodopila sp.]|jgi:hypothetical protein
MDISDDEVIDALWAQIEPFVYITRAQFASGLEQWDIEVVRTDDGRIAFVTLIQGPEFHFASFDTGTPVTRGLIRSLFAPILERHGYVTTRTPREGAERQHRFNRLLGFRVDGESEFLTHYRLDRVSSRLLLAFGNACVPQPNAGLANGPKHGLDHPCQL